MVNKKKVTGADLILKEREKQIKKHKFDVKHDLKVNKLGQLESAVTKLINKNAPARHSPPKMWNAEWWAKTMKKPQKEKLVIAGALIAAQIDILLEE